MYQSLTMEAQTAYRYAATLPAMQVQPGVLQYRIIVKHNDTYTAFPGNHAGDPWAWDNVIKETWQTFVAAPGGALTLFDATYDHDIYIYPNLWRSDEKQVAAAARSNQLVLTLTAKELKPADFLGFQHYIGDALKGRSTEVSSFKSVVVRVHAKHASGLRVKTGLVNRDGQCFAAYNEVGVTATDIRIPLTAFKKDAALLLPRSYPGFQPLTFDGASKATTVTLSDVEKLEVTLTGAKTSTADVALSVEKIWLE